MLTHSLKNHKLFKEPNAKDRSLKLDGMSKETLVLPSVFATRKRLLSETSNHQKLTEVGQLTIVIKTKRHLFFSEIKEEEKKKKNNIKSNKEKSKSFSIHLY